MKQGAWRFMSLLLRWGNALAVVLKKAFTWRLFDIPVGDIGVDRLF
jgi:hypothetical protein